MTQKLSMIAAVSENNGLGKNNQLVWHLPDDFKRFKQLTTGHHIIMGRKTFESFPKPLPNRTHIILTRDKNYKADNCLVVHSLQDAIGLAVKDPNPFIIGGGEIYALALPFANEIELTKVHTNIDADAFFPEIPKTEWDLIAEEFHEEDEKHQYSFTYQTYVRKK